MEREMLYASRLGEMLRAETVSSYEDKDLTKFYAFHTLLEKLFPNLFAVCEKEEFEASLLLKWPGKTGNDPMLFMNHFDVVAAGTGGWTRPAFSGEVSDGKVWGRGALDTKGGLWAMLQAADELAAEGFVPESDIYFESASCEETTFEGARHFGEVLKKRGIRFYLVMDEGGMIMYEPVAGAKDTFAMVGMGERGCADLLFTAEGTGGHASSPETDTPLVRLGRFMAEADRPGMFEVKVSPVVREMFRRLSPSVEGPLKFVYAHPVLFDGILKKVMPKTSGTARALLQSTLAFTMATGSEGRNIIPSKATVVGNMRVSHHQGYKDSLETVKKLAEKYGISTEVLDDAMDSPLSDYGTDAFRLVESAVSRCFPGVKSVPYIMTGCSDARFMAGLTDSCFHFVPFLISEAQLESIHGIDECVDVSTLVPAVEFYKYMYRKGK